MYILWKLCAKNMVENLPVGKKWHFSRIRYICIHFLTDGPNLAGWTVTKAPNSGVYTIFTTTIIIITIIIVMTIITMSYAALRASNLDWIVGPGNSSGGYILGCSQCLASCLRHSAQIGPDLLCHPSSIMEKTGWWQNVTHRHHICIINSWFEVSFHGFSWS